MQEKTIWETIRLQGSELLDRAKEIIHEGNARRVIIKQGDRVVAEFPLTAGVVGTLLAPILAAIGALVALLRIARLRWNGLFRIPILNRQNPLIPLKISELVSPVLSGFAFPLRPAQSERELRNASRALWRNSNCLRSFLRRVSLFDIPPTA